MSTLDGSINPATLRKQKERNRKKIIQQQLVDEEKSKATQMKKERKRELNNKRQRVFQGRRKIPESLKVACINYPLLSNFPTGFPIFDSRYLPTYKNLAGWKNYTLPQILPVGSCIVGELPSFETLFQYVSTTPNISTTLAQAFQKDEVPLEESLYATNIPIPSPKWQIVLPPSLKGSFTIADPSTLSRMSLNLSNKNAMFDFHIDEGTSGISLCTSEKIWIFAPLSTHNRSIFMEQPTMTPKDILPTSLSKMHDVIIIKQTSEYAIWLPTGVLHCTVAPSPGIVYGNVFEIVEDIHIMAQCLPGLFPLSTSSQKKHCVRQFNRVLAKALVSNSAIYNAIACLCDDVFLGLVRDNPKYFATTISSFKRYFRGASPLWNPQDLCPCKNHQDSTSTLTHIQSTHMVNLQC